MKSALQPQPAALVEHPILFSGPMVRAILAGKKTQTRRIIRIPEVVRAEPEDASASGGNESAYLNGLTEVGQREEDGVWRAFLTEYPEEGSVDVRCPYGKPGDRLWLRETWAAGACSEGLAPSCLSPSFYRGPRSDNGGAWFQADAAEPAHPVTPRGKWRPAIHMPRWLSRITLEVIEVRAARVQDISEDDARAEGAEKGNDHRVYPSKQAAWVTTYRRGFEVLWDSINGDRDRADWAANPWVWAVSFRVLP